MKISMDRLKKRKAEKANTSNASTANGKSKLRSPRCPAFKIEDFIVVRVGNKTIFGQAVGECHVQDAKHDDDAPSIRFDPRTDVLAVLGSKPPAGYKVFGASTDYRTAVIKVEGLSPVEVFDSIDKQHENQVRKGLESFLALCSKHKVTKFLRYIKYIHLRGPKTGKTQYRAKFFKDEWHDVMTLKISNSDVVKQMVHESLVYGLAQCLQVHGIPGDLKLRWLMSYYRACDIRKASEADLQDILTQYLSVCDWKDLRSACDSRLESLVNAVRKQISVTRTLTDEELNTLARNKPQKIQDIWPSWSELSVTPRADIPFECLRNSQTYFAHILALYLGNTKLPKDLTKLCKKTMSGLSPS